MRSVPSLLWCLASFSSRIAWTKFADVSAVRLMSFGTHFDNASSVLSGSTRSERAKSCGNVMPSWFCRSSSASSAASRISGARSGPRARLPGARPVAPRVPGPLTRPAVEFADCGVDFVFCRDAFFFAVFRFLGSLNFSVIAIK